jgi:hypothetical protein
MKTIAAMGEDLPQATPQLRDSPIGAGRLVLRPAGESRQTGKFADCQPSAGAKFIAVGRNWLTDANLLVILTVLTSVRSSAQLALRWSVQRGAAL